MSDETKRAKVCSRGPISAARQRVALRIRELDADPRVPWRRAELKIGAGVDLPHLSAALIHKYVADLRLLGLV